LDKTLMRAAGFREFGDPGVVQTLDVPMPVPGAGEVVVKVLAATVNPTDTMMRAGKHADAMKSLHPPYISGVEFAGVIHVLGDGVGTLTKGQPVMGLVDSRHRGGAHAEYVCVPVGSVTSLPSGVNIAEAATIPMNGLTAVMALEMLALPAGKTLLVTGGAGAVGGYVIQLARRSGLYVVADGKEEDRDLLTSLGATLIVPRGEGMEAAVQKSYPQGVDGLVDAALLGDQAAALVRDGGVSVSLRRSHPITDPRLQRHSVMVFGNAPDASALQRLAADVSEGVLTPRIAVELPLTAAARAHQLVEQGTLRGRVVLLPDRLP
jgi:NADPH:quinone reductase-like Zn-dependent oxidoreductase